MAMVQRCNEQFTLFAFCRSARFLQLNLKSRAEFGCCLAGEGDRRKGFNAALSLLDQSDHSRDETGCFARSCCCLDEHGPIQLRGDAVSVFLIGRC